MNFATLSKEDINYQNEMMKNSFTEFLKVFDNPEREGLINTPERMVKAYRELLTPIEPNITVFDSNGYDQMIVEKDIEYFTFCEHHLLPFFGKVKIGYIPSKKIIGLSKLPRITEFFSHRLNTQEYFTQNIANYLQERLEPLGIGVLVTGTHLCQRMRGIKKYGEMVTSALKGIFLTQQSVKEEFLGL